MGEKTKYGQMIGGGLGSFFGGPLGGIAGGILGSLLPFKKGGRVRMPPRTKSGRFRKRK
jgi:hypothetical protein